MKNMKKYENMKNMKILLWCKNVTKMVKYEKI